MLLFNQLLVVGGKLGSYISVGFSSENEIISRLAYDEAAVPHVDFVSGKFCREREMLQGRWGGRLSLRKKNRGEESSGNEAAEGGRREKMMIKLDTIAENGRI